MSNGDDHLVSLRGQYLGGVRTVEEQDGEEWTQEPDGTFRQGSEQWPITAGLMFLGPLLVVAGLVALVVFLISRSGGADRT